MAISEVYEVHPSGDTLFVLCNSGVAFATCDYEGAWHNALPEHQSELSRHLESFIITKRSHSDEHEKLSESSSVSQAKQEPLQMRFSLCSVVLADTCSFFKKSLSGHWKEIEPEPDYKRTLTASNWDGQTFLMVMNILYHKTRVVPRILQLEIVVKVDVLVDYYGCHEAVEPWAEVWISNLCPGGAECYYSRELLLRLTISWVFSEKEKFGVLTKVAIRTSRGPIHTLGLPITYPIVS